MQVAVISDTHIPGRETEIPPQFRDKISAADHTIHAGDFETQSVLEEIESLATNLVAVHGNIDPQDIGLPTVAELIVDDIPFVVTHGTTNLVQNAVREQQPDTATRDDWLKAIADTARVRTRSWDGDGIIGIGGHTHQVEDEVIDGVRVLNPGSVTGAAPADRATMLTVDVADEGIDVTVHEA